MISIDVWKPLELLALLWRGRDLDPLLVDDKWIAQQVAAGSLPADGRRWSNPEKVEALLASGEYKIAWIRKRRTRRKVTNRERQILLIPKE